MIFIFIKYLKDLIRILGRITYVNMVDKSYKYHRAIFTVFILSF